MKAILFDLDGTLLDRKSTLAAFSLAQYAKFNVPMERELYCKRIFELDENGYVRKEQVYAQMEQEYGWPNGLRNHLFEDYMDHFHEYCVPYKELLKTLEELKRQKYLLGLITNGRHEGQLSSITSLGIESFFHVILISESEGIAKPNPLIFERALAQLNVEPHDTIYVGDHPVNDIEAAKKVGLRTIWKCNDVYGNVESEETIHELPEILDALNRRELIELHTKHEKIDWK